MYLYGVGETSVIYIKRNMLLYTNVNIGFKKEGNGYHVLYVHLIRRV